MALQKTFDDAHGVTHATAYWRIIEWIASASGGYNIKVGVYHDAATRAAGKTPLVEKNYPDSMESGDTMPDGATVLAALHGATGSGTYLYSIIKANVAELDGATDV